MVEEIKEKSVLPTKTETQNKKWNDTIPEVTHETFTEEKKEMAQPEKKELE